MEPGPLSSDDDDDAAVVAAFLAEAGAAAAALEDAPTGVILETAPENTRKSPTSVSMACSNGLDDDDLLSGLL